MAVSAGVQQPGFIVFFQSLPTHLSDCQRLVDVGFSCSYQWVDRAGLACDAARYFRRAKAANFFLFTRY